MFYRIVTLLIARLVTLNIIRKLKMMYLHKHRNCYYYKRKIPKTQTNFIISLKTDSLNEAKFIIGIINPKIYKLLLDYAMEQNEQLNFIDELV